jgi:hypothetical protein
VSTTLEALRIRSDQHAGTTGAPAGQTPVVKETGARLGINMVSAVTAKGAPRFFASEVGIMPLCGRTLGRRPDQVPANRLLRRVGSGGLLPSVAPARQAHGRKRSAKNDLRTTGCNTRLTSDTRVIVSTYLSEKLSEDHPCI